MTKVTIDRELLERVCTMNFMGLDIGKEVAELRAILAAPRQPEGDELEAVAWLTKPDLCDPDVSLRRDSLWGFGVSEPLCRLSDAQRAIAELREECERLRRLNETRGDVLTGALHDLHAESMLDIHELQAERDTLRQQLAETRDEITQHSNDLTIAYMAGSADMRQQRDTLASLLAKAQEELDPHRHAVLWGEICDVLAAVKS